MSQNGSFPQVGVKIEKIFELPPPIVLSMLGVKLPTVLRPLFGCRERRVWWESIGEGDGFLDISIGWIHPITWL